MAGLGAKASVGREHSSFQWARMGEWILWELTKFKQPWWEVAQEIRGFQREEILGWSGWARISKEYISHVRELNSVEVCAKILLKDSRCTPPGARLRAFYIQKTFTGKAHPQTAQAKYINPSPFSLIPTSPALSHWREEVEESKDSWQHSSSLQGLSHGLGRSY